MNVHKRKYDYYDEEDTYSEKRRRSELQSIYLNRNAWMPDNKGNQLVIDGDYLIDFNDDDMQVEPVKPKVDKEAERIKALDEFRQKLLADCQNMHAKRKAIEEKEAAQLERKELEERIIENYNYNKSFPSMLTVDELLINILQHTSLETIMRLQCVSRALSQKTAKMVKELKFCSVRVDTLGTLHQLFHSHPSGIVGIIKSTISMIRFKSRHDQWRGFGPGKRTEGPTRREKGKSRNEVDRYTIKKRYYEKPPLFKSIIVNVVEPEDIENLLEHYSMAGLSMQINYCHEADYTTDVMNKISSRVRELIPGWSTSTNRIIYDPYGRSFESSKNGIRDIV